MKELGILEKWEQAIEVRFPLGGTMMRQGSCISIPIGEGVLIVFYEEKGEKWVEIASNYNLTAPVTPDSQKHVGNVFLPLRTFLEILNHDRIRKSATEW